MSWRLNRSWPFSRKAVCPHSSLAAGVGLAAVQLAGLLADHGDPDGAVQDLQAQADAGDTFAASRLGQTAGRPRRLDEAIQILQAQAEAGYPSAAMQLTPLLAQRGDLKKLRALADTGDQHAAQSLAWLLADQRDLEGLRARADGLPPSGWAGCWPNTATWTDCSPGPTPATRPPPSRWPNCWPCRAGAEKRSGCAGSA
jgi:hypothetical protein